MIQMVFTILVVGGCVIIFVFLPFDDKMPAYFRGPVVVFAGVPAVYLVYLSVQQGWARLRAWFKRRGDNAATEEAMPLSGGSRLRAAPLSSAARSDSFVFQSPATFDPLPENPPPYRRTPSPPPRYSALLDYSLGPQPNPRPCLPIPTTPPPFPNSQIPLGHPSRPTAPPYELDSSTSSLEMAIRNCYQDDQASTPLFGGSHEPTPMSSVNEDKHLNSDSEQEVAV